MLADSALASDDDVKTWITGFNHLSLHVRDMLEAGRFWTSLFGAEPFGKVEPGKPVFHFRLPGVVLAIFSKKDCKGADPTQEYPHYAFTVTAEGIRGLKARLEQAGVKTHPLWTRNHREALMYFRDPSGNLFELYCPQYDRVSELEIFKGRGGDFVPPIDKLSYDWKG